MSWTNLKDYGLEAYPIITYKSLVFLLEQFANKKIKKVLEFGSGASSAFFSTQNLDLFVTVDTDSKWSDQVRNIINENQNIEIITSSDSESVCSNYEDNTFDFIFVDGRNRVDCVKNSIRLLKHGGILMLDNSERSKYKEIFDILKDWKLSEETQALPILDDIGKRAGNKKGHNYGSWKTSWWVRPGDTNYD